MKFGNKKAFREIYVRYNKQLFLLAKKYLKDIHLAEDAIQDIYIKLWLKKESLDPEKSIKSFLFTCLKNHVLNMIRNQKRRILAAYELKEEFHPASYYTSNEIEYNEYNQIFQLGLESMPEKRREIFKLKMDEGLSNEQIADRLRISINTVKGQYRQGSKFIKLYLQKEAGIILNI